MKNYYYQVEFLDGRVVRREGVSKRLAQSVYDAMVLEMILLKVSKASYGIMENG